MNFFFGEKYSGSTKIFTWKKKKKKIRIMLGCRSRDSSSNLFMKLKILPLPLQYIFSVLLFVIKNRNQYTVNSKIHHTNTTQHSNFHQSWPSLTKYRKGTYNLGINFYKGLPYYIKDVSDSPNRFKSILKDFTYIWIYFILFYSLDEYFQLNNNQYLL